MQLFVGGQEPTVPSSTPLTLPLPASTTTTSRPPTPTYRDVAFVRDGEIWLTDADGSDDGPLTDRRTHVLSAPDWRPDGAALVAVESRNELGLEPQSRLVVVRLDGDVQPLTDYTQSVANPKWSPDGSRIAYERRGTSADTYDELWVIDADGSDARRIVGQYVGFSISWSPDGRELAYECRNDGLICIATIGGGIRTLPNSDSWIAPTWAPDGRLAVVQRFLTDSALLSMKSDGTDIRVIGTLPTFPSSVDWSPRSDSLVFSMPDNSPCSEMSCPWGATRIFRLDLEGSMLTSLTAGAADLQPTWSPTTASRPR